MISGWHVSNNILTSDHRCISFNIFSDKTSKVPIQNPKATNWDIYCTQLASGMREWNFNVKTVEDVERASNFLMNAIKTAYDKACPLRVPKERKFSSWWNTELKMQQKTVRKLLCKAQTFKTSAHWDKFRDAQKVYKKCLRNAKRDSWRIFCQSIEKIPEISRLHKAFSKNSHIQLDSLQLPSGEYTSTKEEAIKHLLEIHFPGSVAINETPDLITHKSKTNHADWETANMVICKNKVEWAINSFEPFKAAGPDGVFPALLQKGIKTLGIPLSNIFQASIALGYVPIAWRTSKVVFIPKPGRESYCMAKSFRPISLSSFLLKTQEKLVDRYIRDKCLTKFPLNENQHAYRKGRSVESALHHLVGKLERAINQKAYAIGTFADIEGAFDSTKFESIEKAALLHGVDTTLTRWISAMLSTRKVYALAENSKIEISVRQGCPQGGVLSPLLWSMVIDELLNLLNSSGYYAEGYADDIVVIISGKYLDILNHHTQRALDIVEKWCRDVKLSVNSDKTDIVLFTRNRNTQYLKTPKIFGQSVRVSQSVKYLGVILDSKLNWAAHLKNKLNKATISFWHCRRAFGKTWGLKPNVILWIYTAIIRPMFCYGAIVWWPRIRQASTKKQLDHLQRLICMGVTGAMKTTPTAAMEVILSLLPLDIHIEGQAKSTAYRLLTSHQWAEYGVSYGHSIILSELIDENPTLLMPTDSIVPIYDFNMPYSVQYPSRDEWKTKEQLPPRNGYVWYTDGSLMEGSAGSGIHLSDSDVNITVPLGTYCTVFQAEVNAISLCAIKIKDMGLKNQHIFICSDSQAALRSLESPMIKSKLVLECRQQLIRIASENFIRLLWVPGHSSIAGNDKADELARKGSETSFLGPEPAVGISSSHAKLFIKHTLESKHLKRWKSSTTCRQAKMFLDKPEEAISKYILGLDRSSINKLVGVLTGHARLNRHLTKIGILGNPLCDCQEDEEETAEHYLCECPAFSIIRKRTFGLSITRPEQIRQMPMQMVMKFINSSGRFDEEF